MEDTRTGKSTQGRGQTVRPYERDQIQAASSRHAAFMWKSSETAPHNVELELAVIDADGVHALVFPCRRVAQGWIDARNGRALAAQPTHWQLWRQHALTA